MVIGFIIFITIVIIIIAVGAQGDTKPVRGKSGKPQAPLKREIKVYRIVGTQHRNPRYVPEGPFVGFAKASWHEKDKNAIEILVNNRLIGYVPRGNYRLHSAIKEWHNGKVPVWGFVDVVGNSNRSEVYIPLGLDQDEINKNIEEQNKIINRRKK